MAVRMSEDCLESCEQSMTLPTRSRLVGSLRSPAFACSDADLFGWRETGGRWDYRTTFPDGIPADHAVADAMPVAASHIRRAVANVGKRPGRTRDTRAAIAGIGRSQPASTRPLAAAAFPPGSGRAISATAAVAPSMNSLNGPSVRPMKTPASWSRSFPKPTTTPSAY